MKKIYVSFDFEGMAGITNWKETYGNERFNRLATEQINSFLEGFFERNKNAKVVLADSHADGCNIFYENLVGNTQLIKGYPRNFYMVEGLDSSFDGIVFLGYHAPVGLPGNMDHSYSSGSFFDISINGQKVDEATINIYVASYYNVPLLGIVADHIGVNWMKENLTKEIPYFTTKKSISRYAAQMKPFGKILRGLKEFGYNITTSEGFLFNEINNLECRIIFIDTNVGYAVKTIPGVESMGARKIRFKASNPIQLYKYLMTIISVASSVKQLYR